MLRTLLLAASLAILPPLFGCSCFGPQTFCGTLNPQPPQFPDSEWWLPSDIILAVKLGDYQYAADVKVVQVFNGDLEVNQQIRVWGDCGLLCRHYVTGDIGDTVLWAIQHCDLWGNGACGTNFEQASDYQLSVCGIYWLGYENGIVSGPLTEEGGTETMTTEEFQILVDGCLSTGVREHRVQPELVLRYSGPVPVIELAGGQGTRLNVFDARGCEVLDRAWDGTPLRLDGLSAGVFTARVTREEERWVRKLVIPAH